MPPRGSKEEPKGFFRAWRAEWPKIAASLTVAFLLFAIPTASAPVRNWLWPPPVPYPVVCTAEPVWHGGDKRLVEIYVINTSAKDLTEQDLGDALRKALGKVAKGASPAVFFPFDKGKPKAETAVADSAFNDGKGELTVSLEDHGVRVEPKALAALAILRANVVFRVPDGVAYERGAKLTAGMFDLSHVEAECFTR
jgi:hypothetical protein